MGRKTHDVHTSKDGNRWKNTQDGQRVSTHNTQAAAIERGKSEAKQDRVDHVVHGRDGKIRSKDSFGNDSNPPRDTEH